MLGARGELLLVPVGGIVAAVLRVAILLGRQRPLVTATGAFHRRRHLALDFPRGRIRNANFEVALDRHRRFGMRPVDMTVTLARIVSTREGNATDLSIAIRFGFAFDLTLTARASNVEPVPVEACLGENEPVSGVWDGLPFVSDRGHTRCDAEE